MSKKTIIAFVSAILIWGGFMLYRQYKLDHEHQTRGQKEFERLLDAAKRSPIAGLSHMGRALNEYNKENNVYPPKLMDLYPKFIPSKRFIEELDWEYERMEDDFYLSKMVFLSGKGMVAYVDSELRPEIDSEATAATSEEQRERLRLAAAESKRKKIKSVRGKLDEQRSEREGEEPLEEEEDYADELASLDEITSTPLGEDFQAYPSLTAQEPAVEGRWVLSEDGAGLEFRRGEPDDAAPVDDADDVSASISEISERVLVWKYKDGVHGFGNIQYPEAERVSIAVQGKWRYLNWRASDGKTDDEPVDERAEMAPEADDGARDGKSPPLDQ